MSESYNNAQRYTPDFVRLAQMTLGATPACDGEWREFDTDAVKTFQRDRRMKADGKVGPQTAHVIRAASGILRQMPIEFWWDAGPIERMGTLSRFNVKNVALMLNRSSKEYRFEPSWRWRDRALYQLADAAHARNIGVVGTVWVRPNKAQIDATEAYLRRMILRCKMHAVEVELEGNWEPHNVFTDDFETLADAGVYLLAALQRLADEFGVAIEATAFAGHDELRPASDNPEHGTVTHNPLIGTIWPQVYSHHKKKKRGSHPYTWGAKYGPGQYQARYMQKMKARWPDRELVCGLAAYGQAYPKRSPVDAMERALCNAAMNGAVRGRYWSAKHLTPGGYTEEFLSGLKDE